MKNRSFEEYLKLINPYLNDLINNEKDKGEWKLQLTAQIIFHKDQALMKRV